MDNAIAELESRAKAYQGVLCEEGFAAKLPKWDADVNTWDVSVKYEGIRVLIMFDLDDPKFIRVVLPNFWHVAPVQLGAALVALDIANKRSKFAKVFLNPGRTDTTASVDFLDDGKEVESALLVRYLSTVTNVTKVYLKALKEETAKE
jgi:hypothetical protein